MINFFSLKKCAHFKKFENLFNTESFCYYKIKNINKNNINIININNKIMFYY